MERKIDKNNTPLANRHINWSEVFDALSTGVAMPAIASILVSISEGDINTAAGKSILSLLINSPITATHIEEWWKGKSKIHK